jgi:glycyl-tRNA synthetase beta chain
MVREFTELQGTMGGIYARAAGEPEPVWKAIYYQYLPMAVDIDAAPAPAALGAGRVTWAALSLADKLDTLVGLFHVGERPTGSRDPYGLRRQAHGVLRILADGDALAGVRIRTPLGRLIDEAAAGLAGIAAEGGEAEGRSALTEFLAERAQFVFELRGAQRQDVRSVLAAPDAALQIPISDLQENLRALPEVSRSAPFRQLATAFKRVRNIARDYPADAFAADEQAGPPLADLLEEPAERALLQDIENRGEAITRAVRTGTGFREAYLEAARFEPVVARFFDDVFVMTDDMRLRQARLRLLKRLETSILQLGDISEIVASE